MLDFLFADEIPPVSWDTPIPEDQRVYVFDVNGVPRVLNVFEFLQTLFERRETTETLLSQVAKTFSKLDKNSQAQLQQRFFGSERMQQIVDPEKWKLEEKRRMSDFMESVNKREGGLIERIDWKREPEEQRRRMEEQIKREEEDRRGQEQIKREEEDRRRQEQIKIEEEDRRRQEQIKREEDRRRQEQIKREEDRRRQEQIKKEEEDRRRQEQIKREEEDRRRQEQIKKEEEDRRKKVAKRRAAEEAWQRAAKEQKRKLQEDEEKRTRREISKKLEELKANQDEADRLEKEYKKKEKDEKLKHDEELKRQKKELDYLVAQERKRREDQRRAEDQKRVEQQKKIEKLKIEEDWAKEVKIQEDQKRLRKQEEYKRTQDFERNLREQQDKQSKLDRERNEKLKEQEFKRKQEEQELNEKRERDIAYIESLSRSRGYIRGFRDFWGIGETEEQRIERKLKELEEERKNRPSEEDFEEEPPEQKNTPGVYQDQVLEQKLEEIKCSVSSELFEYIESQCKNRGDFSTECVINLLLPSVDVVSMNEEDRKKLWTDVVRKVHPDKCVGEDDATKKLAGTIFNLLNFETGRNSGRNTFYTQRRPKVSNGCPFFELNKHLGFGVAGAVFVVCKPWEQKRDCKFVVKIQPIQSPSWKIESSMLMYISDHPELFDHKQIVPKIYGVCESTPREVFGENWTDDMNIIFQNSAEMKKMLRGVRNPKFGFIFMERFERTLAYVPDYCKSRTLKQKVGTILDLLHKNGIYHGDLHANNIFVNHPDTVVFADFGRAYAPKIKFNPPLPNPDFRVLPLTVPRYFGESTETQNVRLVETYDNNQFRRLFSC